MKRKHRRLSFVALGLLSLGVAAALVLTAFEEDIVFFYAPTDLAQRADPPPRAFRLGGLVEEGSVEKAGDGVTVKFRITDNANAVPVVYAGILPDLFREGQGVVTEGSLGPDGVFTAREVLAKHDENYMPKEVAEALKKSGEWRGENADGAAEVTQ